MGITIGYGGRVIGTLNARGRKTAKTAGKYLTEDITVDYTPDAGTDRVEQSPSGCSGTMATDGMGSIAVQLDWRPERVEAEADWGGGMTRRVVFENLDRYESGTLLGKWMDDGRMCVGKEAIMDGYPGSGIRELVVLALTDGGFSLQGCYRQDTEEQMVMGSAPQGQQVVWRAEVQEQQRRIPAVAAGFIRAGGDRLRDDRGNAWVCRAMNARLNLVLGVTEALEQQRADWELSLQSYQQIAQLGFNTVKLLFSAHFFETEAGQYRQAAFDWLDQNIAWAKQTGLKILLNCHRAQGGAQFNGSGLEFWTVSRNQTRLAAMWQEIARRYAGEETILGYGIFNEPWVDDDGSGFVTGLQTKWSIAMQRVVDAIRQVDGNHIIFLDAALGVYRPLLTYTGALHRYYWQTALVTDHNLCMEWHDYQPSYFLNQNADSAPAGLRYPGRLWGGEYDPETGADWQLEYMGRVSEKIHSIYRRNMPVFIGEVGGLGLSKADEDSELRGQFILCLNDKLRCCNQLGYGYGWHLWAGADMGWYPTNPTAVCTANPARSWLNPVFTAANAAGQTQGQLPQSGGLVLDTEGGLKVRTDYVPRAVITFVDDDGHTDGQERFIDVLKKYGFRGCLGIITEQVGKYSYYTLDQLKIHQQDGFEILNHTATHSELFSDFRQENAQAVRQEILRGREFCRVNGFTEDAFVWPYIDPHNARGFDAIRALARECCRYGIGAGGGRMGLPLDSIALTRFFAKGLGSEAGNLTQVEQEIDRCIQEKGWLIIGTHSHYEIDRAHLDTLCAYVADRCSRGLVEVKTFSQAAAEKGNLYEDGDFYAEDRMYIGADGMFYGQGGSRMTVADDGQGNVMLYGVTGWDDGSGNVTF